MRNIISVDLGQQQDYTAISVITVESVGTELHYRVKHLERMLGIPYPKQVERVIRVANRLKDIEVVIDQTGCGRPVWDMFNLVAGLRPYGVTITSGDRVTKGETAREYRVPKRDLVGSLHVALSRKTLKISNKLPDAKVLKDELVNFRIKITTAGNDTYSAWREADHDDLVLSVAQGIWLANYFKPRNIAQEPTIDECYADDNEVFFDGDPENLLDGVW